MPTYEYECKSCGHNFEAFQSMSDAPLAECPQCGRELRRLINGGSGVIFKGSGFYVNDKNKGTSKTTSSKTKSADSAGSKEQGSKDHDGKAGKSGETAKQAGETNSACASCPGSSGCPASDKAAG